MTMPQERYLLRAFWAAMAGDRPQLDAALTLMSTEELEKLVTASGQLSRVATAVALVRYRETRPELAQQEEPVIPGDPAVDAELSRLKTFQRAVRGSGLVDAPPLPDRE